MNIYDNQSFFDSYGSMARSSGLEMAGEWYVLKPLLPDFKGKKVLDMGCGYGWHCKYAAENGAEYVKGVDGSEKMIAEAQKRNADGKIEYAVADIETMEMGTEEYDAVVSNLVLHYIENLKPVYEKVYRALKKGGVFVFNIEHPVFTAGVNEDWVYGEDGKAKYWPVDGYYYPGERETVFLGHKVKKQHHTLTQILMGLLETGFEITAVKEPAPAADMMNIEGMADEMRRPMMLIVRAEKR